MSGVTAGQLWVENDNGTSTTSFTHNFAPSNVLGQAFVQGYYEAQGTAGIDAHISEFVQNGSPNHVFWSLVSGSNITSITYSLQVSDNAGRAIWRTDFF